jgi:hypothetical protein
MDISPALFSETPYQVEIMLRFGYSDIYRDHIANLYEATTFKVTTVVLQMV